MGFFDCIIQLLKIQTNYKITTLGNKGQEDLFFLVFCTELPCLITSPNPIAEAASEP